MITRQKALDILHLHLKNKNLIYHSIAVEAAMGALAKHFNEDVELWKMAGLLHDADWEETQEDPQKHTGLTIEWIQQAGETNAELIDCILTHNSDHNGFRMPKSNMEWSLYTCDELTGLIVATALVRPEKSLAAVEVKSVLKKFPQKSFAKGVERERIQMCEERLNIPLENFVEIVLNGMQENAAEIGL